MGCAPAVEKGLSRRGFRELPRLPSPVSLRERLGSCTNVCFAVNLPVNKISQEICKIITTGRTCTVRLIKLSTVINCYFQKIMYISEKEEGEPEWKTREDRASGSVPVPGGWRVTRADRRQGTAPRPWTTASAGSSSEETVLRGEGKASGEGWCGKRRESGAASGPGQAESQRHRLYVGKNKRRQLGELREQKVLLSWKAGERARVMCQGCLRLCRRTGSVLSRDAGAGCGRIWGVMV